MSSRGNGKDNGGGGAATSQPMPASTRKMLQSLKEVVNCPEQEIYAALKDCNMDPDDAINRLLSQDPFREVKSKREKKKENKDTGECRSRGINSTSNRGSKGGVDRYVVRGGSHQFSSPESGVSRSKPPYKKDIGPRSYSTSVSATSVPGNYMNQQPPSLRDPVQIENNISTLGSCDGISSSSQPSSGVQSAWLAVPGQVSMADIVKMGRTHGKASTDPYQSLQGVNNHHILAPTSGASQHDLHMTQGFASKVSGLNSEPAAAIGQHVRPRSDEWPSVEQPPAASLSSVAKSAADSELYAEPFNKFSVDRTNQHIGSKLDEVWGAGDGTVDNFYLNSVSSASISSLNIIEENSGAASLLDKKLYEKMNSYQPQRHNFEAHEDASVTVSSTVDNMQQLSLQDDQLAELEEDGHCVKIPAHLQVQTEHLSHLSFGSFGTGINAGIPGLVSQPLENEEACSAAAVDSSSVEHLDTRNSEYYGDEHVRTTSDGSIVHRSSSSAGIYDSPSVQVPKALKEETHEDAHANQYTFPSSAPGYNYESTQHSNLAFAHSQSSSQMPDHASFSNAYSNALPNTLLASTAQPARESDLDYAPFPKAQSLPSKYNTASAIGGPTINIQEALRASNFSSSQSAQTMPGTNVATGPALPQHLTVHPYSQPNLSVGHYANMIGYSFLPQSSYTYLPSAFQQAFSGTSSYHQSLAAVLPQYKNNLSASSLSQSAAAPSGYGAFESSSSIPGNFPRNPPTASTGTAINYDNIMNSRYKDGNSLISAQQNENSEMWLHGLSSRAASSVPANAYYNYQGQNQQATGFRQSQQLTQHAGNLVYPNFYNSQAGNSLEHHQNPRDALGGTQGQQSNQSQQIWQNSY